MLSVLVVEDDTLIASTLKQVLTANELNVTHIEDGSQAKSLLSEPHSFDLILLDLNLPGASGLEILESLRGFDLKTPVLILTARVAIEDRVRGLDLGADDYLAKPFSLDELEARVRALLRRASANQTANTDLIEPPLVAGELLLDREAQRFLLKSELLSLPQQEHRLLTCLIRHVNEPVSRVTLTQAAFMDEIVASNAIEVYIHRLRHKLYHSNVNLRTIRGVGYMLEAP